MTSKQREQLTHTALVQQIHKALDALEGGVHQLPDLAGKPECIDLLVRLRLAANKVLEAARDEPS